MVDLLRRSMAPIVDEAWDEIESEAKQIFKHYLVARTLVNFDGPHGWEYAAVNTGRLDIAKNTAKDGVEWGARIVQPLIEIRSPFTLDQFELDNIERGCDDVDLEPLQKTAVQVARFEDDTIFNGFDQGGIQGIIPSLEHDPLSIPTNASEYPKRIMEAVNQLDLAGVNGPYTLVLGEEEYQSLMQLDCQPNYPIQKLVKDHIGGDIICSPVLQGGLLLSTRGGDFELTVGQDLSIGYAIHDKKNIELYITESFTFRVLDPAAAIALKS